MTMVKLKMQKLGQLFKMQKSDKLFTPGTYYSIEEIGYTFCFPSGFDDDLADEIADCYLPNYGPHSVVPTRQCKDLLEKHKVDSFVKKSKFHPICEREYVKMRSIVYFYIV